MSLILKSNTMYSGTVPAISIAQITSNPQKAYQDFRQRVLDDGGEIVSQEATETAIKFMFDNGLYGKMAFSASPSYARKLGGDGGIEKLYSIDGVDLVANQVGAGGSLPTVSGTKAVRFAPNSTDGSLLPDGFILSTEEAIKLSGAGRIGLAFAAKVIGPLSGLPTNLGKGITVNPRPNRAVNNIDIMSITFSGGSSSTYRYRVSKDSYGSEPVLLTMAGIPASIYKASVAYYNAYGLEDGESAGMTSAHIVSTSAAITPDSDMWENEHFVDFGGYKDYPTSAVVPIELSVMWLLKDASADQYRLTTMFFDAQYS